MELDVVPEPEPAEGRAIAEALADEDAREDERSEWWRRGVRENVEAEGEPD